MLSSGYAYYLIVRKKKQKIVTDLLHCSFYAFSTFAGAAPLDNSTDLVQALSLVQELKPSALTGIIDSDNFMNLVSFHLLKFQWPECLCEHITGIPFENSNYNAYKFRLLLQLPQINLPVFTLIGLQSGSKVTWHSVSKNTKSVPSEFCASLHITFSDTNIIISLYNI